MKQKAIKILKYLRIISRVVYWVLVLLITILAVLTLISATGGYNGLRVYSVSSGSMEPTITTGSIVLTRPFSEYEADDIVTFKPPTEIDNPNPGVTTTHRITSVGNENGMSIYTTKGDANSSEDSDLVNENQIIGKVIFHMPEIGYLVAYARTTNGVILMIIIPAVIIIYDEILKLKKEIIKLVKGHKCEKL